MSEIKTGLKGAAVICQAMKKDGYDYCLSVVTSALHGDESYGINNNKKLYQSDPFSNTVP